MTKINIINLKNYPILKQLQLEELLLRSSKENYFIFNQKIPNKAVVMGLSAKPVELLNIEKVKRDKIQVLRRFTGGGTVVVDDSTIFTSFIMNSSEVNCKPYPREIMTWSETIFAPVFRKCQEIDNPHDIVAHPQFELLQNDYVIGAKKIAGNAQTISRDRWVHHTSFLWDFHSENMDYLLMPKKRPEYRQNRPHLDFLLPIKETQITIPTFQQIMLQELKQCFQVHSLVNQQQPPQYTNSVEKRNVYTIEKLIQEVYQNNPEFQARTYEEDVSQVVQNLSEDGHQLSSAAAVAAAVAAVVQ